MDTRQMRLFVALAETLHFGRAAQRQHMTQPPFSRQIANLERELGVQLVVRNSRRVTLTPAGQQFYEDSRSVLARLEHACRDARLVALGQKGELRLGFMMHAAHRIVPLIVSRYAALRPDVRLHLVEATPANIEEQLLRGELDAAITFAGPPLPRLQSLTVLHDRLCFIAPVGHPLASLAEIGPSDLADVELIAAPASVAPILRQAITGYFAVADMVPRFRYEPELQHTIVRLVAAGLGVALVPATICDPGIADIVARPLKAAPGLQVVLAVPRIIANPAVLALIEIVRSDLAAALGPAQLTKVFAEPRSLR